MKHTILFAFLLLTISARSQKLVKMKECLIEKGQLKNIEIDYNPATGDRTVVVNGTRKDYYSVYPQTGPEYAAGQSWFINNETVKFDNRSYVKYGLPRILGTTEIKKHGSYKGLGVYVEAALNVKKYEVIYIPVRSGCEFQPYVVQCGNATIQKVSAKGTTVTFKATVTGLTGKISYAWSSEQGKIVRGQGTATITVDYKGAEANVNYDVTLTAKDAADCPVVESKYVGRE